MIRPREDLTIFPAPGAATEDDDSEGRVPAGDGEAAADAEGWTDAGYGDTEWRRGDGTVINTKSGFCSNIFYLPFFSSQSIYPGMVFVEKNSN